MSPEETAALLASGFERHRAGRFDEAIAAYGRVLEVAPAHADALNLCASALRSRGEAAPALALARRAAAAAPERPDILYNLGNALSAARLDEEATTAFRAALTLAPNQADAAANLGIVLTRLGDVDGAEAAYRAALTADPDHRTAAINLGNLLGDHGRADEALASLEEATRRHPALAEAHYDLGLALLRFGDWRRGFAEYDWRWKTADFASPVRHADLPDWDGRPFPGRRLLVHAEQGLGDTIQFCRLLPLAASLGGCLTFEVPSVLVRLLSGIAGADIVTDRVEPGSCDLQTPLLGLPHRLGLSLGAISAAMPVLTLEAERVARWRDRLGADHRPIVGLVWRGNAASPADRGRSLPSAAPLAPLAAIGVRLVCLHRAGADDLIAADTPTGFRMREADFAIEHPGPEFDAGRDAFLDAVAVLSLVDRVVTTDTALAHLAGTLARPTDLLLRAVADWRWGEGRDTTPWYPSVRLLRQTTAGDWSGPIERAAAALATLTAATAA